MFVSSVFCLVIMQGPRKGEDDRHKLKVALEDLYNGKTCRLAVTRNKVSQNLHVELERSCLVLSASNQRQRSRLFMDCGCFARNQGCVFFLSLPLAWVGGWVGGEPSPQRKTLTRMIYTLVVRSVSSPEAD